MPLLRCVEFWWFWLNCWSNGRRKELHSYRLNFTSFHIWWLRLFTKVFNDLTISSVLLSTICTILKLFSTVQRSEIKMFRSYKATFYQKYKNCWQLSKTFWKTIKNQYHPKTSKTFRKHPKNSKNLKHSKNNKNPKKTFWKTIKNHQKHPKTFETFNKSKTFKKHLKHSRNIYVQQKHSKNIKNVRKHIKYIQKTLFNIILSETHPKSKNIRIIPK